MTTGYNEAFVIDREHAQPTHLHAIRAVPKSLNPSCVGVTSNAGRVDFQEQYLLFIRPKTDIEQYPAVKAHLLKHYDALSKKAGGNEWYELQSTTAYYQEFEKPKIICPDISHKPAFVLDLNGRNFLVNTGYIIGTDDSFICRN
jgi:hypothetical protein